jgi:hypothetical protein
MNWKRLLPRVTSSLILITITTITLHAQTNTTPTPAPTKTPSSETIVPEQTESLEEGTPEPTEFTPLTQSDLNIITGNVQRPNGIAWYNNKLYVLCSGDWTIYEIDDRTGSTRTYIYGTRNAHSLYPEAADNGGLTIWVPDFDQSSLLAVNTTRAPSPVATNLQSPWGIAPLDEEHFIITSFGANTVSSISRRGEIEQILSGLRSPTGIVHDDGYVYVANSGSARRAIEWFKINTDEEPLAQPLVTGLQNTTGITLANDDYLYSAFSLGTRGVIGRIDPVKCREQGGCTNNEVEIVLYTELAAPLAGLAISPDMRLFVHTMFRPEIYWVQLPLGEIDETVSVPKQTPEAES